MYLNSMLVGGDGASMTPRGLIRLQRGEVNGQPVNWDERELDPFGLDSFDLGELDFEHWDSVSSDSGPEATQPPEPRGSYAENGGGLSAVLRRTAELANNVGADNADVLKNTRLTYQPFPIEHLPEIVSRFVTAGATAIGCDPAYLVIPVLGTLARAIGNRRVIELKDTWREPAVIWGAIVGPSGTHKSPAIELGTRSLQEKEAVAALEYEQAYADYEDLLQVYESDKSIWSTERRKQKGGLTTPPPQPPPLPTCTRYLTSDCTIEALAKLLNQQSDGLLVVRDELAGWLGGIAEYKGGRGSDLGHWLACWSGLPMTVDRKTSDQKIRVAKAVVSLIGGIQPGVLQRAIGREHLQDGLCARLLLVMPESKPVCWSEEVIPTSTVAEFEAMVAKLLELPGTQDPRGHETPIALALSPGAKALWVDYYNRHRSEMDQLEEDLRAAASKLEAYTARFALIFQLASWAADEPYAGAELIDEVAMLDAIALSDWFLGEAKRVYALFGENDDERHDRELVEFIQRRGGRITARELQSSSRRYRKSGAAEAALDGLVKAAYGQWEVVPTGRRPRYEFILSALSAPTLFNYSADSGNNADSTGAENGWADQLPF